MTVAGCLLGLVKRQYGSIETNHGEKVRPGWKGQLGKAAIGV
jgi:hypothetical protein